MFRSLLPLLALATATVVPPRAMAADEFPVPEGFTSTYETVDGIPLHYVKGGAGSLVYLVHGFGQSWYEWHQLMSELAKHHTVVAVDLPGIGQSWAPTSYRATDVSHLLYGLALKMSGGKPFELVAHDIGIWNTYPMLVLHQAGSVAPSTWSPHPRRQHLYLPRLYPQG